MLSFYKALAHRVGTQEALELAQRLAVWHDAMVSHERQIRQGLESCDEECPHQQAGSLWKEAQQVFGDAARELVFLRSRAEGPGGSAGR
ncbi:MAG TPA: hypothetical protein VNI83_06710 [Vicinamibacterales bacterium]|nr:hypothetical protein [Vicinamibacterales bacterium]